MNFYGRNQVEKVYSPRVISSFFFIMFGEINKIFEFKEVERINNPPHPSATEKQTISPEVQVELIAKISCPRPKPVSVSRS